MKENLEKLAYDWVTLETNKVDTKSVYYCKTRDIFDGRLNKMVNDLLKSGVMKEELVYIVSAMAGEIGNNSFDHNIGNWPEVMGIFFSYNTVDNKFKVVLADRGQGVLKTLKRVRPALKNDAAALRVAFTEKISGRAPESRGNGLKFVKENIKKEKMYLTFISGDAQAELNKGIKIRETKKIRGCLAILKK
jgi:hypothetical protein